MNIKKLILKEIYKILLKEEQSNVVNFQGQSIDLARNGKIIKKNGKSFFKYLDNKIAEISEQDIQKLDSIKDPFGRMDETAKMAANYYSKATTSAPAAPTTPAPTTPAAPTTTLATTQISGDGTQNNPFKISSDSQRDEIAKKQNFFFYILNGKKYSYNQEPGKEGAEIIEYNAETNNEVPLPASTSTPAVPAPSTPAKPILLPLTGRGIRCKVCRDVQAKIKEKKDSIIKRLGADKETVTKLFGDDSKTGRLTDGYLGPTTLQIMILASGGSMNPQDYPTVGRKNLQKSLSRACNLQKNEPDVYKDVMNGLENPEKIVATVVGGNKSVRTESWSIRQKNKYANNLFERLTRISK